jgi:long-chain acyl-CoA synthetase
MHTRPWHANYDEGVPHTLEPYPDETLVDVVRRNAATHSGRAALRFEGAVTTYGNLWRQAEAFAVALEKHGVKRGDRVALVLPNCPQFVVAELGAWLAGAIVSPVNFTYPDEEIAPMLERSGATVAVVLAPFYERIKGIQGRSAVKTVIVAHVRDALPRVKGLLFRLFKEKKEGHRVKLHAGDMNWSDALHSGKGKRPKAAPPSPSDIAVLLPSGGTTGTPKLVAGSHGGLTTSGSQLFAWLRSVLEPGKDTLLVPLPLFHTYGFAGIQSLSFVGGLSMTLVANPRDTVGLIRTIRRERPAFLCAVPTLLTSIMSHRDVARSREAFGQIKLCFSGAAPLLAETARRFEELTGGVIVEGYSLTEAKMAVIANPARGRKKIGSIGMPLPDVDIRLVDSETGNREVSGPGEQGEVLISARQLMLGYWEQPGETAEVLKVDEDGRRWLYTGDIGYLDEEGYLFLTDRKKELIKVSGYQVWPREVEEVVGAHPAVLEVGVSAVVHGAKGEVPKAWVVLREGATARPHEIRAFCRDRLAPYKVPAEVSIVEALPKSAVGKVLRRKLKELDEAVPVA